MARFIDDFDFGNEVDKPLTHPLKANTKKAGCYKKVEKEKYTRVSWPKLEDTLILAFDTEYQLNEDGTGNDALCYTYSISQSGKSTSGYISVDPDSKSPRLKFEKFIVTCIEDALDKKVLSCFPKHLMLGAHFLKADISQFADFFDGVGVYLSGVRKTLASLDGSYGIDVDSLYKTRIDKSPLTVRTKSRNSKDIYIKFYDTLLLSPAGKSLAEIGKIVGLEKLDIPASYSIEKMREYKANDIEGFKKYAIRDADIARLYLEKMVIFCLDNNIKSLPLTIGGIAEKLFKRSCLKGSSLDSIFGYETKTKTNWNVEAHKPRTIKKRIVNVERLINEQFAILAYQGGRNEAFWSGLTPKGTYYDYDVPSCYTTAMIGLREIDYAQSFEVTKVDDIHALLGDKCAFAYIDFEFPRDTCYPSLPVRMDSGLIFPLTGKSFCTGHELEVAINLGVKITSIRGRVFPWKNDVRIFESYVKMVLKERRKQVKGGFEELLWKELGNVLYGKIAQGLRGKNAFDIESGLSTALPYTNLTNPLFAAYTTGLARATLSEMLNNVPSHYNVISVTTDGFITNAPLNEIRLDTPLCKRFDSLYSRICEVNECGEILKMKHAVNQLICMKTRGQITVEPMPNEKIILAKAGVRPPLNCMDHNQYMMDLYRHRSVGDTMETGYLTSTRDMYLNRSDMIMVKGEQRLNLEFDFKRWPVDAQLYQADEWSHVGCATRPLYSIDEGDFVRAIFKGFRQKHCLKTVNDVELFEDFYAMQLAKRDRKDLRIQDESSDELLIRIFLRHYKNSLLGLDGTSMNATQLSEWLCGIGYSILPGNIRSAKNLKLLTGCVPRTALSLKCLSLLQAQFPDADFNPLFSS